MPEPSGRASSLVWPMVRSEGTIVSVTVTVTIRPKARTQIQGLPWTGKPSDSYAILEECIGAIRHGQVLYANGSFSVARSHTQALISALAQRFGWVHVIQYGGTEKCRGLLERETRNGD